MILFQVLFEKFSFVELFLHRFAALQIGKSTHKEEGVGVLDGQKWSEDFHSDFLMLGQAFRFEYLQKFRSQAGFDFIGAHFDDHAQRLHRAEEKKNAVPQARDGIF